MSKSELLERREEIIAEYGKPVRKSAKRRTLTKKERKVLGIGRNEGKATLRHLRMNAFKVNALIKQVKGKSLEEAYAVLLYTPHGAAQPLTKLLKSAEANAVNNNGLDRNSLYVAEAYATQGPTLKRISPRAQGRAFRINKRTSHLTLVLREKA